MSTAKQNMAMFFTRGMSLETWVSKGMFSREKILYEKHIENDVFQNIYWITYGRNDLEVLSQLKSAEQINPKIYILPIPKILNTYLGHIVFSFLSPFIHKTFLKTCSFFKSNQMDGSWSAIIASILYGGKNVIRTGYSLTRYLNNRKNMSLKKHVFRLVERLVYKRSDLAFVTTNSDKLYLEQNYSASSITVVPNYIDIKLFNNIKISPRKNKLLFVGRLDTVKNLKNMLHAANEAGIGVDLVGSGPLKEELVQLGNNLKIDVNMLGTVPNDQLPHIYNSYRYFILPSLSEGMPKVLIEAMACGCVCIGTNVQGINEVIKNGHNGILAIDVSKESIFEAIDRALNLSEKEAESIAERGIQKIRNEFSLDSIVKLEQIQFGVYSK